IFRWNYGSIITRLRDLGLIKTMQKRESIIETRYYVDVKWKENLTEFIQKRLKGSNNMLSLLEALKTVEISTKIIIEQEEDEKYKIEYCVGCGSNKIEVNSIGRRSCGKCGMIFSYKIWGRAVY
ncbi:MAG: hypothetical protein Q7T34_01090, partial [Candidatus Parcubacteria bacterium]|nr:hypothetical protein [Candidatus Parcubacteria bacterium]